MDTAVSLGTALVVAFLCEGVTEYFFEGPVKGLKLDVVYLRYVSALVGVALCVAYGIDIFEELLDVSAGYGVVGEVLTGLVLGRGANYVHDFYSRFVGRGKV